MTERLHVHFSFSCIGGGNGNPLQCSCLENPRDGGAWWAAIYGVAQSWILLKQLSSSIQDSMQLGFQHLGQEPSLGTLKRPVRTRLGGGVPAHWGVCGWL